MELDFFTCFEDFMTEMQERFPKYRTTLEDFEEQILNSQDRNEAVNTVLAPFRPYSRNLLTHDPEMFEKPVKCFGGINLSEIFLNTDPNTQFAIWQYLETLYVSGNVFLKPHKKEQFLKAVWKIKSKYPPKLPKIEEAIDDNAIDNATSQLRQMFGGEGLMGELLGDISKTVGDTLKNNNPNDVLQNMLSGDLSMFGNVFEEMDRKYGDRLQNEDVDQNQFMQNASRMLGGGRQGNQMMNPFAMMQGMMQGFSQENSQQIHDVQTSPYFSESRPLLESSQNIPTEDNKDPPSDSDSNN